MKRKFKRLASWIAILFSLTLGIVIILKNFQENIVFFVTPTELMHNKITQSQMVRLGGIIVANSIIKKDLETNFKLTDQVQEIEVYYHGPLPTLFREGQGIVVKGKLVDNVFWAEELLTKHDENYMPKEVADAIKKSGNWKP